MSNIVGVGGQELIAVVEHARPCVVGGTDGAPQGGNDFLGAREPLVELLAGGPVGLRFDGSALGHVDLFRVDAKMFLRVFLVAEDDVAAFYQFRHHIAGLFTVVPELGAIVQVGRDGNS